MEYLGTFRQYDQQNITLKAGTTTIVLDITNVMNIRRFLKLLKVDIEQIAIKATIRQPAATDSFGFGFKKKPTDWNALLSEDCIPF